MNLQPIKTHKWAILLAFLVGIIVAFPQFYFPYDHSETYQGIYIANSDSESYYLNRVQEVRDGHPSISSVDFQDGKNDPYLMPPLNEILVAYLGKIFFLDLNNTILLSRFLFSFLGFLAVYGFVFLLLKEKLTAISAATAVCLAKSLLSRGALIALLKGAAPVTTFLDLGRPVHPQVDFLFFFGFLLFFWLFFDVSNRLSVKKRWIFGGISTLILSLSFYSYPYAWSFLYAFLGVLCFILFFQKKWPDLKRIIPVALGGIFIALPYFLNFYEATLYSSFEEIIFRARLLETHQIILGFLAPSMFIIFLFFFPRKWRQQYIFSLALFIAPFIVLNQQLITGKDFSSGHYHWNYHQPLAVVFLIIILLYQTRFWQEKLKLLRNIDISKILAFLIIGLSIYTGIVIQSASYKESETQILSDQKYGPVIEWLNVNIEKEEVVLAAPEQLDILSIYTSLNSFYPTGCFYLSASNERLLSALFLFYRLDGVSGEDARDLFLQEQERGKISANVYGTYYKNTLGSAAAIPDQLLLSFAGKYQDFLLIPLDKFFKMRDIKYVVWDKKKYPQWQLHQYPFLNKVYEEGDFVIYEN